MSRQATDLLKEDMEKRQFVEDLAAVLEVEAIDLSNGYVLDKSNWDSLAIVSTIVLIDEQFGVTIAGDKLRNCDSIGALWQLIQNARGPRA